MIHYANECCAVSISDHNLNVRKYDFNLMAWVVSMRYPLLQSISKLGVPHYDTFASKCAHFGQIITHFWQRHHRKVHNVENFVAQIKKEVQQIRDEKKINVVDLPGKEPSKLLIVA